MLLSIHLDLMLACYSPAVHFWRCLVLFVLVSTLDAAEVRRTDRVLPLIQDGEGWSTEITIVNLEAVAENFELLFRSNKLQPWEVAVTGTDIQADGAYVRGKLAPGGSVVVRTAGKSAGVRRGYAMVYNPNGARLGAKAVVRLADPVGSLTLPLSPEREDRLILQFNNVSGAETSLLWVSETPYALVDISIRGMDGKEIKRDQFQFSAVDMTSQEIFVLADRYPETKNLRGTIFLQLSYPNAGIYDDLFFTGLVIQTQPGATPTAIGSMATESWRASRH
jgi:hypothetical protein